MVEDSLRMFGDFNSISGITKLKILLWFVVHAKKFHKRLVKIQGQYFFRPRFDDWF